MILVTGGTGITGSFVIEELKARGVPVRALARPQSAEVVRKMGVQVVLGDLSDRESLLRAALGVTGIIHVACTFQDSQVDIAAMEALLDAWDQGPFVFISSVDVYGYPQKIPISEEHRFAPPSDYGKGKVLCEKQLQIVAQAQGRHDWSILRPPHIWGPHPRCYGKIKRRHPEVWAGEAVVLAGATAEEAAQFGDDWIDARELAWASVECLTRPLAGAANAINNHFTWPEFFTELIRLTGSSSQIEYGGTVPQFYSQKWRYTNERLNTHLNYEPSRTWQETLAEVIALAD